MSNEPKHTATPIETIEEAAKRYYEENIDQSNIPREHYEFEIQDLMIGFVYKWQSELESFRAVKAELIEALRVGRNELERAKMSLIQSNYSEQSSTIQSINNALTTLAKYEKP